MYDEILFPQLVSAKCIAFHYKTSKYNTKVKSDDKCHICRSVFTGLYLIKLTTNQGDISKLCLCLFVCFSCRELLRFWKFSAISVNSETHGGHFMAAWRYWKSKGPFITLPPCPRAQQIRLSRKVIPICKVITLYKFCDSLL